MHYLLLYQFTPHWLLFYSGNIMLLCYATADFHLFYDVAADVQKWALLTRSQCRVSDTQVPVKTLGPLVQTKYRAVFQWDLTTTFKGNCIIIHVALLVNVSRVSDVAHGPLVKFQYCTCTFKQTSFFAKITWRVNQGKLINMKCC